MKLLFENWRKYLTEQGLGDVRARADSAQSELDAFRSRRRPSPTSQPTTSSEEGAEETTQQPTTTTGQTQQQPTTTTGQTQRPTRTQSTSATVRTADMTPEQQEAFRTMAADTSSIQSRNPSLARSARAGRLRRAIAGGWDPSTGEEGLYRYHQEQGTRYRGPYQPPE